MRVSCATGRVTSIPKSPRRPQRARRRSMDPEWSWVVRRQLRAASPRHVMRRPQRMRRAALAIKDQLPRCSTRCSIQRLCSLVLCFICYQRPDASACCCRGPMSWRGLSKSVSRVRWLPGPACPPPDRCADPCRLAGAAKLQAAIEYCTCMGVTETSPRSLCRLTRRRRVRSPRMPSTSTRSGALKTSRKRLRSCTMSPKSRMRPWCMPSLLTRQVF